MMHAASHCYPGRSPGLCLMLAACLVAPASYFCFGHPFLQGIFLVARELYTLYFADSPIMNLAHAVFPEHHRGGENAKHMLAVTSAHATIPAIACMALKLSYGIGNRDIHRAR